MDDLIDRINKAVGCQQCGRQLGASPSDDFCSQWCQEDWHAARSKSLEHYEEPSDLPVHVYNQHEDASPETTPDMGYLNSPVDAVLRAYSDRLLTHPNAPAPLASPSGHMTSGAALRQQERAWLATPQRWLMGVDPANLDVPPVVLRRWEQQWAEVGVVFSRPAEPAGEDPECE